MEAEGFAPEEIDIAVDAIQRARQTDSSASEVYLVESGEYEDRGIEAVFDTMESAEALLNVFSAAEARVILYTINASPYPLDGGKVFCVRMDPDGDVISVDENNPERLGNAWWSDATEFEGERVTLFVWAADWDDAEKVAGQRRLELIEEGKWTPELC